MPTPLQPGMQVDTRRCGKGRVVRLTRNGAIVALDAAGGLEFSIPLEDILIDGVPAATEARVVTAEPMPVEVSEAEKERRAWHRTIEALRFGIVPPCGIEHLTLGYERLEEWTKSQLPNGAGSGPGASEVCGPFGTGKSHTMAVIRHIAAHEGYLTASVDVDGTSVSLSDPGGLLYQLWSTLGGTTLESATPLLDLHLRARDRSGKPIPASLRPFDRVVSNYETIGTVADHQLLDDFGHHLDAIVSSNDELPASRLNSLIASALFGAVPYYQQQGLHIHAMRMVGMSVDQRPRDFCQCLLGYAVLARLAGYKGLVVTLDEFEVEYHLSQAKFERVCNLVDELCSVLQGRGVGAAAPLSIFIGSVGQEGHVGDAVVDALVEATGGDRYVLTPWPRTERHTLAQRIHAAYDRAYGQQAAFDSGVVDRVEADLSRTDAHGDGLIRAFIKRYVAELDVQRGPPWN